MVRYGIVFCLFLVGGGYFFGLKKQEAPNKLNEIAHFLDLAESIWHFRGTVFVAKGGKIIFRQGYGMADEDKKVPNTTDTIFRLASITKTFTATAIMQLQEKGLLNIHDPIVTYFPDFPATPGNKGGSEHCCL